MEVADPRISSISSLPRSITIYTTKNPSLFKTPFSIQAFRVSAHFNTRRRKNHLRKKLIQEQVLPTTINPNLPISSDVSNPQTRNDALWDQLENWANHYKIDAKFLGNDSNLDISTVFQDPIGKVDVNQDVVLPYIDKLIDKDREMGRKKLQTYVGDVTGKPGFVAKASRVGVAVVFCGFLVFIGFNKFFRKEEGDEEEYTSLEKEMLRRKVRARMAREKSAKGSSVEVIQDSKEPDVTVFKEKPRLDKEELMKSIGKVKAFDDTQLDKIEEIRAMARHAREIESGRENIDDEQDGKVPNPMSFDSGLSIQDMENSSDVLRRDDPNISDVVAQDVEVKGSNLFDIDNQLEKKPVGVKLGIISSVKEAREYLQKKEKKQEPEIKKLHQVPSNDDDVFGDTRPYSNQSSKDINLGGNGNGLIDNTKSKDEALKGGDGELGRANREKWTEDNFHEFEPLIEKIRDGFKNNYMVAREKVKEDINLVTELERDENESEFEWMKDEKLREIVFQVRENELMGRDPFYLMDTQDKALFFKGLEKKVEKENEKLAHLHQYLHSNIENLDYGADGISLYDSPEKIIPRWKGPPPATTVSQEFLDDYLDQRKALFAETLGNLNLDSQNLVQRSNEKMESKDLKRSKTVIEGSDGSVKPVKKSGKEFWQHTKKWSRGFLDSYNAENDPETKAAMKDIGKDLDRWITEKEIQEAADIMDKVPDKGKKFIAEKISKLKREMELFGPQAVVSKYSEYGEEEEIDYYWWLDLPFLLCIEMYIDGDGDERIGFYSLEMASDLELDPKPHHIIAFEDAGDCKNFCYIIQMHMEMLGNGNAFVVPQLPKDTYREAKDNGFNVTVIRKGELKLDVDQTLEEVEEKIVEIGSKMYHDQIMKSRNVNVDAVMKGVFGVKKTTNRRRLKRPTKRRT
ncbi:hypothetical protein QVD17_27789 [Tagetes erecta]|uniref:Uncharacterized protein n=1 Tax=Tagetes erecta TaxID=13708 RepID=A0AAD8K970_TARER|nr:hypothetical protein QVD17_27789 [Tagetes erecta]